MLLHLNRLLDTSAKPSFNQVLQRMNFGEWDGGGGETQRWAEAGPRLGAGFPFRGARQQAFRVWPWQAVLSSRELRPLCLGKWGHVTLHCDSVSTPGTKSFCHILASSVHSRPQKSLSQIPWVRRATGIKSSPYSNQL